MYIKGKEKRRKKWRKEKEIIDECQKVGTKKKKTFAKE